MSVRDLIKIKMCDVLVIDLCEYTGKTVYSRGVYVTMMTEEELRATVFRVEDYYNAFGIVNTIIHAYMDYDDLMNYQKGDQKDDN